ncbi:hypothetical protein BKA62DRAFT_686011 [Auriculariales sp. MPI-PUGE-AT-0066]|nr:hypothetical protein BKA62DRAFT_686011 [Auriculariales sp. MPI-PUGE-AT-0066]
MSERLEIESDEDREDRLQRAFAQQHVPTPPSLAESLMSAAEPSTSRLPERAHFCLFLPQMAAANAAIAQMPNPRDARMELSSDDEDLLSDTEDESKADDSAAPRLRQVIHMDLGLGVFEQRQLHTSESTSPSDSDSSSNSSSGGDLDAGAGLRAMKATANPDSESDSDSDNESGAPVVSLDMLDAMLRRASNEPVVRPIRPLPQRALHAGITMLSTGDSTDSLSFKNGTQASGV